ncbi:MAG: 50S ribosomal protein L5 [Chlamydiae bacterium]|nr:50S ribosomal protein L5 [Chlamydiota bacterium]
MTTLADTYKNQIVDKLKKKFSYTNIMQVPKVSKVIINMGIADALKDKNAVQDCISELTLISGQKPIVTKASKSISNFKLREGQGVGLKVTIRGQRMYDFIYRFVHVIAPRIRDFRGFKAKCDGHGNYSLGVDDQQIFPEINLDKVKRSQGMHITFVTSAQTDAECFELLKELGIPFKKDKS